MNKVETRVAIVFDWDGTLMDSDFLIDLAVDQVLTSRKLPTLELIKPLLYSVRVGRSLLEQVRLPEAQRGEIILEISNEFKKLESEARLFDGAHDLLINLRKKNIPLGILTGRNRNSLKYYLKKFHLEGVFNELVCRNEVPLKPNPAGLYKLKEALGVQAIIFIGNSLDDQEAAISAGTDFVAIKCCERVRIPQVFLNNVNVMKNFQEISNLLEQKLKYFSLEEQAIN